MRSRLHHFTFLALLICLATVWAADDAPLADSIVVSEQSLPFTYGIRIRAFTEKSEKINNPVRWLPLETVIADGTYDEISDRWFGENILGE